MRFILTPLCAIVTLLCILVNSGCQTSSSSEISSLKSNIICGLDTEYSWWEVLSCSTTNGTIEGYGLLDTGAGCNRINKNCADKLGKL